MSPSLEPDDFEFKDDSERLTLAEAAARLGCHVETLRVRVRQRRLEVSRGPHGRYYVTAEELSYLLPPRRMKRRDLGPAAMEPVNRDLNALIEQPDRLAGWQRGLLAAIRNDPEMDLHLYRVLAVNSLLLAGLNTVETAEQLDLSVRHIRRLRRETLTAGLKKTLDRLRRRERGIARRASRPLVREIQQRLEAAGFRPARRNPRAGESGARGGRPARVALVRDLSRDQIRHLLTMGLTREQVDAISLLGIGSDELNELSLHGLPEPVQQSTQAQPNF